MTKYLINMKIITNTMLICSISLEETERVYWEMESCNFKFKFWIFCFYDYQINDALK